MITTHAHRSLLAPLAQLQAHLAQDLARLKTAFAKRRAFARTVAEMNALADRDLADLGLCRAQIRSIAMEHIYGA